MSASLFLAFAALAPSAAQATCSPMFAEDRWEAVTYAVADISDKSDGVDLYFGVGDGSAYANFHTQDYSGHDTPHSHSFGHHSHDDAHAHAEAHGYPAQAPHDHGGRESWSGAQHASAHGLSFDPAHAHLFGFGDGYDHADYYTQNFFSDCSWHVWFGDVRSLTRAGSSDTLTFEIYTNDGRRVGAISGAPTEASPVVLLGASHDHGYREQFVIVIPAGQFAPSGVYTADVPIELYLSEDGGYEHNPTDAGVLRITTTVSDYVSIAIAGVETIDFGDMTVEDVTRTLQLTVVSNSGYKLEFKSDNGGVLRHETEVGARGEVAYGLAFGDGQPVDLGAVEPPTRTYPNATGSFGETIPLEFTAPRAEGKRAGAYSDTLEIIIYAD